MSKLSDDDLMEAVHDLMHLARAQLLRHMPDDGLGPMEGRALGFFVRHPGSTQTDHHVAAIFRRGQHGRESGQRLSGTA